MSITYHCDEEQMNNLVTQLTDIETLIEEAEKKAKEVEDSIEGESCWKGDTQKAMKAFLGLVLQYHRDFINGEGLPLAEMKTAIKNLQTASDGFYEGWAAYTDLEGIE